MPEEPTPPPPPPPPPPSQPVEDPYQISKRGRDFGDDPRDISH